MTMKLRLNIISIILICIVMFLSGCDKESEESISEKVVVYCSSCGAENYEESEYCSNCGVKPDEPPKNTNPVEPPVNE